MKPFFAFLLAAAVLFGCTGLSGAQLDTAPDEGKLVQTFEKFYADLAKKDVAALLPRVIRYSSLPAEKSFLHGEALTRGPEEPVSITPQSQFARRELIEESFKRMTGQELVTHRYLMVKYAYPKWVREVMAKRGSRPFSKFYEFEDIHWDLWMLGADGEWRVACDYHPGYGTNNQSLGLSVTDDKAYAETSNAGHAASRLQWEKSLVGE